MIQTLPTEVGAVKNKLEAGTWFYRVDMVLRDASVIHFCNNTEEFTYSDDDRHRLE